MPLIHCNLPDKQDTSLFCYVNPDGTHVSPRRCTCMAYAPKAELRQLKHFPAEIQARYKAKEGEKQIHTMPLADYKKYRLEKYGKVDPDCPIFEAHSPIDPNWL